MKRNIRFSIWGCSAAATLLLAAACERELPFDAPYEGGETATVSFAIRPETLSAATRANETDVDYTQPKHISDGQDVDLLVYAVYTEDGEPIVDFDKLGLEDERTATEALAAELGRTETLGDGQIYMKIDPEHGVKFPVTITVKLSRGETYKVAFWAQNSDCDAYDIKDLKRVQVHYKEYKDNDGSAGSVTPNNDEMRDAFCRVETVRLEKKSDEYRTVYLYRPLAQINVGTSGYDFETVVKDKDLQYKYSRMQIVTAARYLDVVNDKIAGSDESSSDTQSGFEFDFAPIPAYYHYSADEVKGMTDLGKVVEKEEFLRVRLFNYDRTGKKPMPDGYVDEDGDGFLDYADAAHDGQKTETFKWLSMGYVLVPSGTDDKGDYTMTTINKLRVWLASDPEGTDAKEIVNLDNVAATRNWRTNIVGDVLTAEVPLQVVLDKQYAGDYNGFYQNGDVTWSGPLDEHGGAWYDAENDEILISNVSGLLWLQQMVNGNLVYTRASKGWKSTQFASDGKTTHTDIEAGMPIQYYDENGVAHSFGEDDEPYYFKGIKDPTLGLKPEDKGYEEAKELKERILRATHQITNVGYNPGSNLSWPTNNNFHFVGTKMGADGKKVPDPANVKLVADIDLSGIEWLGIGFDCRMGETYDLLGDNMYDRTDNEKNWTDKKLHRGFFGNFDGNGHTVSNLKTKRFALEVHPASWQQRNVAYEAVQWFARGFFGQLGGTATVRNLTLRNVDIYGNHCVGGIAGVAVGVGATAYGVDASGKITSGERGAKAINIENCIVDGGRIENVPMYRGDVFSGDGKNKDRTFARGVNTGGIVGLYNAGGSVAGCQVRNLTVAGYRTTGGIVGCVENYIEAYVSDMNNLTNPKRSSGNFKMASVSANVIQNTTILSDHFKPFDVMQRGAYSKNDFFADWAYGFAWIKGYSSYCHYLVGGEHGGESTNENGLGAYVTEIAGNTVDGLDVRMIDYACDVILATDNQNKILGREVNIENATVEELPVLNNWFVDEVTVKSNLLGTPAAYKRYKTHPFRILSFSSTDERNVMWDLPNSFDIAWDEESGKVGMRVGAVKLDGEEHILSVRDATGEKDCAMQISSCDRNQFKGGGKKDEDPWFTDARTTVKDLTVRGNPYAYTGICLSPNASMSAITLSNVTVYDVYQTIALDGLSSSSENVWPKAIDASGVTLTVEDSNLRGYTVPGEGWKSVAYSGVIFEQGSRIPDIEQKETEYTCRVDGATTFENCTFKAPYIIVIAEGVSATFTGCKAAYGAGANVTDDILPAPGCTKIIVDETGKVSYEPEQE